MLKNVIFIVFFLFSNLVFGGNNSNTDKTNIFIENEINTIVELIKSNEKEKLEENVNRLLSENFDYTSFIKGVMGRKYWLNSNEEEKKEFSQVISKKLKKTYLHLFESYSNEKITIKETTSNKRGSVYRTKVIVNQSGKKITILFYSGIKNGIVLIKDLVVEGISLRRSFNSGYKGYLRDFGVKGTIVKIEKELEEHE